MEKITFEGYNPSIQFLRRDKSFRITIDVSRDQWENIKDVPLLPEGVYEIEIKPVAKDN
jgi:hypothetical protein